MSHRYKTSDENIKVQFKFNWCGIQLVRLISKVWKVNSIESCEFNMDKIYIYGYLVLSMGEKAKAGGKIYDQ